MLSLPAGTPLKRGLDVAATDFVALYRELRDRRFSGYVSVCVRAAGTEEGTVLFDGGKIVGCAYEYYRHGKTVDGAEGFRRVLNALGAKNGVMDIFTLTPEQVQLTFVVNEGMIFVPVERDLLGFKAREFSPELERQVVTAPGGGRPGDILKKYKIGEAVVDDDSTLRKMESD